MSARHSKTGRPASKPIDWLVYKVGGSKAALLGTVKAPDADSALAQAFEEFKIASPAERRGA